MADLQARLRAWTKELNDCDHDDKENYVEGLYDYIGDRDKGETRLASALVNAVQTWKLKGPFLDTYMSFLPVENVQATCRDLNKLKMDILKSRASESIQNRNMLVFRHMHH